MGIYFMDVEKQGTMAFVYFGGRYMICIGTQVEVYSASEEKLVRMIWEAVCLATTKDQIIH